MKAPSPVPKVRDYLGILASYWMVIVAATALSIAAGWLAHRTTDPTYQATSRLLVVAQGTAEVSDAYNGQLAAAGRAVSIQQLALNPQVAKRTVDQMELRDTPAKLIARITTSLRDTVLEISVTADSPELARDITNSVTVNLVGLAQEMADLDTSVTTVVPVDYATAGVDSRAPLLTYLELGAALGLLLSAVLVIALGRWRNSILTQEHLSRVVEQASAGRSV